MKRYRRHTVLQIQCIAALLALVAAGCTGFFVPAGFGVGLLRLPALGIDHPRAFFFRASERPAKQTQLSYEEWEATFERLMGIEGKVLDEELPGLSWRNIEFFTRFKERHPDQLVLLHFNGNARDPEYQTGEFFAGHWLYYNGCRILSDVPATGGETDIRVANSGLFRVNIGRYKSSNEDIALCPLGPDGRPVWQEAEQVRLISVDHGNSTIRVQRGCYGTSPRAFAADKSYAAPHAYEGPWGSSGNNLLWNYNYSTEGPRDAQGRSTADVLLEEVVARFQPGGELQALDGVQFDVLYFNPGYLGNVGGGRGIDANGDGVLDLGIVGGVNTYGLGVVEYCRRLRERLPPDKLLLADGHSERNQRAFLILNGIESEGFPSLNDREMKDWSSGLNRHFFWRDNARPPVFNYINHKYTEPSQAGGTPNQRPDVPFGIHRLSFAAAAFTDAAVCYSYAPSAEPGETFGVWDELWKGTAHQIAWLGKPLGPPIRLAKQAPDILNGIGAPASENLLSRLDGSDVQFSMDGAAVKVAGHTGYEAETVFRLKGVPTGGEDLYVSVTARAAPWKSYPPEVARLVKVRLTTAAGATFMTWANEFSFTSGFYFDNAPAGAVDIEFTIEGTEPLWLTELTIHAHPDAICREFENGVVLANPSPRPFLFDLTNLFPGRSFRRLQGSSRQDPATNNGSSVGGTVELGPKDALFLVEEKS